MNDRKSIAAAALAVIAACSLLPTAALADPPSKPGWQGQRHEGNRGRTDNTWNNGHKDKKYKHDDKRDKHEKHGNRGRTDNTWNNGRNKDDDRWRNVRDDNRSRAWQQAQADADKRQKTKNEWRNLALAAGGVAAYGLLRNDKTLMFAGAAGALYSLNRYEQDRKSQSAAARARAHIFSQSYFTRDGNRYERRLVTKNGQRYYQFVRK